MALHSFAGRAGLINVLEPYSPILRVAVLRIHDIAQNFDEKARRRERRSDFLGCFSFSSDLGI